MLSFTNNTKFSPAGRINTEKILYPKTQILFLYLYVDVCVAVWMLNPYLYSSVENVIT